MSSSPIRKSIEVFPTNCSGDFSISFSSASSSEESVIVITSGVSILFDGLLLITSEGGSEILLPNDI